MLLQDILSIVGIVFIVLGVAFIALAAFIFFRKDVRGVRDDLSGKKRLREIGEMEAQGTRTRRRGATDSSTGSLGFTGDFDANTRLAEGEAGVLVKGYDGPAAEEGANTRPSGEDAQDAPAQQQPAATSAAPASQVPAEEFDPDAPTTVLGEVPASASASAANALEAKASESGFVIVRKIVLRESTQVIEG